MQALVLDRNSGDPVISLLSADKSVITPVISLLSTDKLDITRVNRLLSVDGWRYHRVRSVVDSGSEASNRVILAGVQRSTTTAGIVSAVGGHAITIPRPIPWAAFSP